MANTDPTLLGGDGKVIEADETYQGKRATPHEPSPQRKGRPYTKRGKTGGADKRPVVALVERGGRVRAKHMMTVNGKTMRDFIVANVERLPVSIQTSRGSTRRSAQNSRHTRQSTTVRRNTRAGT